MPIQLSGSLAITGSITTSTTIGAQGAINTTNATNPTSFTSTASFYTDGGIRVTKDMFVSGTSYFNNVTVYGTQSVQYITSSQVNIGTNIITVNTDTPAIRFGGLAVYDSGSTGLTGSMLWDSEANHWVYSNPSGSLYSGGMLISGPRSSALGTEQGTTSCMLLAGQGGDHLTSSMIYHSSTATCIPNTLIGSTVCTTMTNASCIGINTTTPFKRLTIDASDVASDGIAVRGNSSPAYTLCETSGVGSTFTNDSAAGYIGTITNHPFNVRSNSQNRLAFSSAGVACFACQVCTPSLISSGTICSTGNTCVGGMGIVASCLGIGTSTPQSLLHLCSVNNASVRVESACDQAGLRLIAGVPGTARATRIDFLNGATCVGRPQWTIINDYNQNGTNDLSFTNCDPATKILQIFQSGISCFGYTTCTPTLVAGSGGIRSSNNIIFPANLTTFTIWNEGYGGAVQLRRSDASTDRYSRIGIVDAVGNWVSGMTINGGTAWASFDAGICAAQAICAPTMIVSNCINIGTTTSLGSRLSIESANDQAGITMYNSYDCNQWSLRTGTTGINNKGFSIVDDICNLTRIQIDGAGRVGIGTLIPQSKFHISIADRCAPRGGGFTKFFLTSNDTDTNYYEFQSTSTTQSDLLFSTGNTGNYGIIGYNHCTDSMRVYTKSNIRLTINGDGITTFACQVCSPAAIFAGCVGIGTTTPYGRLHLTGVYNGAQNTLNLENNWPNTHSTSLINFWAYYNSTDPMAVIEAGQDVSATNAGVIKFKTMAGGTSPVTRMSISPTGVTCFSSTVCAPGIYVGTSQENIILSSSRIHLNTCVQRFYTINHWQLANGSANQCIVVDGAATYGCAKVANINATETFFYGPYSYLTPGSYVAKFRMKVDNNSSRANLFYLDTNVGAGVNISANTFCTSGCYQYISLPFTISSPSTVFEARALNYTSGITCTYLDHVLIEAQENPGQYFSKDNFRLYTGHFNCARLSIDTNGNTIFNCNGTYCSNFGYNFLTACNGSILSGTHTMGNMGAGITCATPYWCDGGALRTEFNWSTGGYVQWINHNNCTPFLLQWSTNYITKHCFDYGGNACHSGIVIANGYQGASFSTLSAGAGTGVGSFDTITRSGVGLYEVAIIANPNAGGSDYYDYWYGHLIIGRGYSGTVTDFITWCQESPPPRCLYPSGGGGMTVTACMYYSGAEYSSISRDGSYTIRFKISGYNSSYTGANTTIYLKYLA